MGTIIRQIARTALLCGTLGLLLYMALAWVAETPIGTTLLAPLLGLAAAVALLIPAVQDAISAWRSGIFPSRGGAVLREREPIWFLALMIWQIMLIVMLVALLLYLFTLLPDRWSADVTDRAARAAASAIRGWL
jgi:hypothetical protein